MKNGVTGVTSVTVSLKSLYYRDILVVTRRVNAVGRKCYKRKRCNAEKLLIRRTMSGERCNA